MPEASLIETLAQQGAGVLLAAVVFFFWQRAERQNTTKMVDLNKRIVELEGLLTKSELEKTHAVNEVKLSERTERLAVASNFANELRELRGQQSALAEKQVELNTALVTSVGEIKLLIVGVQEDMIDHREGRLAQIEEMLRKGSN